MVLDFMVQLFESINPAVACPSESSLKSCFCLVGILDFQNKAKYFLYPISAV